MRVNNTYIKNNKYNSKQIVKLQKITTSKWIAASIYCVTQKIMCGTEPET